MTKGVEDGMGDAPKFNDNYSEAAAFAGITFSQACQFDSYMEYLLGRGPAPGFLPSAPVGSPTTLDGWMKDPEFAVAFNEEQKALEIEESQPAESPKQATPGETAEEAWNRAICVTLDKVASGVEARAKLSTEPYRETRIGEAEYIRSLAAPIYAPPEATQ